MTATTALEQGRQAFEQQAWAAAWELLRKADTAAPLEPEDLERAARAAYLSGHDDDCVELTERAFDALMRRGEPDAAALAGFWLVFTLANRGDWARAGGWIGRSLGVIDGRECVAHGYLGIPGAIQALTAGDAETAYTDFSEAREVGRRFGDGDLTALGGFGQGQALIALNRVTDGMAVLDELMVDITAGRVSPVVTGLVYCGVIAACMETFDPGRAREWTVALNHWCDAQPDLVPFRGQCLVHRAQIMQIQGAWVDAAEELDQAFERLTLAKHPAVGDAVYEQAEVRRLRGDFDGAERAYRQATQFGRDAQPGLALLRLAQGQIDRAAAGLRRALEEARTRLQRPRHLAAAVEIALAAKDGGWARSAADELADIAVEHSVPLLGAMTAQASATVLLAEGDTRGALAAARRAWTLWQRLGAAYEAAKARVVIGMACRALGDEDAAVMEFEAARTVFDTLAARPDVARVEALAGHTRGRADCGLTAREVEVLRLVATGKTNRSIAGELFLSEKTVARHVSNIFTRLGLSTRAAATAYAYEHGLV
jgi:DNA-binding CsgD family transcriptional regulator/tetratricopeptide (TPR) repeat protein